MSFRIFFFYLFPFIPSHKTPGAWSSRWKAELVLIFIFYYFLCLKRQEAADTTWIPASFWNPWFLQKVLPPPTLGRELRNHLLSPPIVIAGTMDAAGSQCLVAYSPPGASGGVLHTNQKASAGRQERAVDTRRLSPTHVISQMTTGLTVGALKGISDLRSNRTYQNSSTLCQKYHTRWVLQHANNKENKF